MSDDWDFYKGPDFGKLAHEKILESKNYAKINIHDVYAELKIPTENILARQLGGTQQDLVLPDDILSTVMLYLDASSIYNLSSTCRSLNALSLRVVPGLHLKLFPHQVVSGQPLSPPATRSNNSATPCSVVDAAARRENAHRRGPGLPPIIPPPLPESPGHRSREQDHFVHAPYDG